MNSEYKKWGCIGQEQGEEARAWKITKRRRQGWGDFC